MEQTATEWTEWIVHRIFFWETDDAKKGRIVRTLHHGAMFALATMIVVTHTVYPAFWLQTIVLGCGVMIWVQHVLTNGCVISRVEQKLIGDDVSFVDPFLDLFHIEANETSKHGIVILGSTVIVGLLSLEWVSRLFHKLIPFVRSQIGASLLALHIPPVLSSQLE